VTTDTFSLPNLVSQWQGLGNVIPEFAPHSGLSEPVVEALEQLLISQAARKQQSQALDKVVLSFADTSFNCAADHLLQVVARQR